MKKKCDVKLQTSVIANTYTTMLTTVKSVAKEKLAAWKWLWPKSIFLMFLFGIYLCCWWKMPSFKCRLKQNELKWQYITFSVKAKTFYWCILHLHKVYTALVFKGVREMIEFWQWLETWAKTLVLKELIKVATQNEVNVLKWPQEMQSSNQFTSDSVKETLKMNGAQYWICICSVWNSWVFPQPLVPVQQILSSM